MPDGWMIVMMRGGRDKKEVCTVSASFRILCH